MKFLNFNMDIPANVLSILNTLQKNNYEAYVVGGCVRDSLLGKKPKDWDITTNATPEQVKECFELYRILDTGLKHGTVTIMINGEGYEVTTYRIDGDYTNHRQPDFVLYSQDLIDDLKRRDFTINAIAYNPINGFVDPFNGIKDIKRKVIRCVGDPNLRFEEDALRILRAIRFSNVLGFSIAKRTRNSLFAKAYLLDNISTERINVEFSKTINCNSCNLFDIDYHFKALAEMYIIKNSYHSILIPYQNIPLAGHLALRLQDISTFKIKQILQDLRYDNKTIELVFQIRMLLGHNIKDIDLAKLNKTYVKKTFLMTFKTEAVFIWLDILSQRAEVCFWDISLRIFIKKIQAILTDIFIHNECYSLKRLKIDGTKLQEIGFNGVEVGVELNKLLNLVVQEKIANDVNELAQQASEDYIKNKYETFPRIKEI